MKILLKSIKTAETNFRGEAMRKYFLIFLLVTILLVPALTTSCTDNVERGTNMVLNTAIPAIDANVPAKIETATFALGWFWGPDSWFGSINGVIRTRVGYAGGTTDNPTYYNIGNYSETIQIDYDPSLISYEELLNTFWKTHDPTYDPGILGAFSRQYMSVIFYHDEEQKRVATESKQREEAKLGKKIYTDIMPFSDSILLKTTIKNITWGNLQNFSRILNAFILTWTPWLTPRQ